MKKLFITVIGVLCSLAALFAQQTATTLGKDFWLTFLQSDDNNPSELSINISAREAARVTIENPTTGLSITRSIEAGGLETIVLLGTEEVTNENGDLVSQSVDYTDACYVGKDEEETISHHALHITSDQDIAVFAANWREKSFDVANVLPTNILRDEYVVACYRPEDHESKYQGSHFAIIATEDNTVVDFVPTAQTQYFISSEVRSEPLYGGATSWTMGDTLTTPVMNRGDVFYVWSGERHGIDADLTGTYVRAKGGKKIAVFNGNPHTNIGLATDGKGSRDRDHIFSQAYPTVYWGTQFPIVASQTTSADSLNGTKVINRKKDKIRVLALYDGTEVRINGELKHTFDFATNPRHYYEFELGTNVKNSKGNVVQDDVDLVQGISCYVQTSCPTATHLYMVSNRYDYPDGKYCNGDPAMIWMNPIEQQIDKITFATYKTMDHFLNIVTDAANTQSVTLDEAPIEGWQPLAGNNDLQFARVQIAQKQGGTHTLAADNGFTAHVYGFKEKESYGYSAGGSAIQLERSVTINGVLVKEGEIQQICQDGEIPFVADLNYDTEVIRWDFDDGTPLVETQNGETINHTYEGGGTHRAHLYIKFANNDQCGGRSAMDEANLYFDVTNGVPDMIAQRAGDFLVLRATKNDDNGAVLVDMKKEFEGATYQWYRDGQPIEGATLPYLQEQLQPVPYYVRVGKTDGTAVYTCPIVPDAVLTSPLGQLATISRTIISAGDPHVVVDVDAPADGETQVQAQVVSAQGVLMSSQNLGAGQNTMRIASAPGIYVLDLRATDGRRAAFKVVVR